MGYFYCYDKSLMKYLRYDRSVNFICSGLHPKLKNMFWLFPRTTELDEFISEYNSANK
jgi:hypothetical protein